MPTLDDLKKTKDFFEKLFGKIKDAKGIVDFIDEVFGDDGPDFEELLDRAVEEIVDSMQHLANEELLDKVRSFMFQFKQFDHFDPDNADLAIFLANGADIIESLETKLRGVDTQFKDPKWAYFDAAPFNAVVPIYAAALKMRGAESAAIHDIYRRALAVNFRVIGEPTSQELIFNTTLGFSCPKGVRCRIYSRIWQHLFHENGFQMDAPDNKVLTCFGCYSTTGGKWMFAELGSDFGTMVASEADNNKCRDLLDAKFNADSVVSIVADANKHLLAGLADAPASVRDIASRCLDQHGNLSLVKDIYGQESPQAKSLRAQLELVLTRC